MPAFTLLEARTVNRARSDAFEINPQKVSTKYYRIKKIGRISLLNAVIKRKFATSVNGDAQGPL